MPDEEKDQTEVSEEEVETEVTPEEEAPEETEEIPEETKPDDDTKFTLPEEEKKETSNLTEIIHNGQAYSLTQERMVELAQKGFDYDFKVGPHGKLAQMIDSDPEITKLVDNYWQGKTKEDEFKITPIEDHETEDDWLQSNFQRFSSAAKKQPQEKEETEGGTMADGLRSRDPEYFDRIYPKLDEYAQDLSMKDYRKVDSDMGSLCKFYDFVKKKEMGEPTPRQIQTPGFRIKSGGGERSPSQPVWKLSKDDFQKQLDKAKGF